MDALRDLDDPLTLASLFAALPSGGKEETGGAGIPAPDVADARRLVLEWGAWVARAHALRRVFVSVKGMYYQVRGAWGDC